MRRVRRIAKVKKSHLFASFFVALIAIVSISLALSSHRSEASAKNVILLYGWKGAVNSWSTAKADYIAQGYNVYVPTLADGTRAGDTVKNAKLIQDYITANGLTNVKLDGHSLGGWLALYIAFGCTNENGCSGYNPAVTSVVLRDTGTGCFFGQPPDQCDGSSLRTVIKNAPQSSTPILEVKTASTVVPPQVDCSQIRNDLKHNDFLSNLAVTSLAIGWPDVNPCLTGTPISPTSITSTPSPTPTPTRTPTPTPTRILTPTPTGVATPTPRCSWWWCRR